MVKYEAFRVYQADLLTLAGVATFNAMLAGVMDLPPLLALKEKLMLSEDLSDVWNYFFDHFGEDPSFIALGDLQESELLESILERLGTELFGPEATLQNLQLTLLREHNFAHGSCFLAGRLATVIYFAEVGMGTIAVDDRPSGMTQYVRFTQMGVVPADPDAFEISLPLPPGSRAIN